MIGFMLSDEDPDIAPKWVRKPVKAATFADETPVLVKRSLITGALYPAIDGTSFPPQCATVAVALNGTAIFEHIPPAFMAQLVSGPPATAVNGGIDHCLESPSMVFASP